MLKEKNNRQIDDVAFRILHAEDDPVLSAMVAAEFEDRGHAVVSAENGREALQRLGEREFDVALFDIDMPELSGLDVLAALREGETKNRRNLPAIMVTGNKGEETIQQAYALGATSFVTKPLNIDLLARHLQFVMRADRNEMRLRAAVAAARKSERARLELVTRITHEMRTPLAKLAVCDEGVGLPLEELQHVAKPFSQGDSGLTRSSQGLGLGLSIANRHSSRPSCSRALFAPQRAAPTSGTNFFDASVFSPRAS